MTGRGAIDRAGRPAPALEVVGAPRQVRSSDHVARADAWLLLRIAEWLAEVSAETVRAASVRGGANVPTPREEPAALHPAG
jgi:hypothetical protein